MAGGGPVRRPAARRGRPAQRRRPVPLLDHGGDHRRPRHGVGTTSTWRSRTGSTTSTSARSSAPPTRSWPPRCTSSATAGGTAVARWSPTATSTCATTLGRRPRGVPARAGVTLLGIDNLPGSAHLETMELPASVCLLFGQEGPGLSEAARSLLTGLSRSLSSARPGRSTPRPPRRSPCTPGSAARRPVRRRRLAGLSPGGRQGRVVRDQAADRGFGLRPGRPSLQLSPWTSSYATPECRRPRGQPGHRRRPLRGGHRGRGRGPAGVVIDAEGQLVSPSLRRRPPAPGQGLHVADGRRRCAGEYTVDAWATP